MSNELSIKNPGILHIKDGSKLHFGANQTWYPQSWQRQSGCGPTTCSHLIYYLANTKEECERLWEFDGSIRKDFLKLMIELFQYVTPKAMGVNKPELFTDGAMRFSENRGVKLTFDTLKIPKILKERPSFRQIEEYLLLAFQMDLPVAFLNLSNGSIKNLESWHWVTLVGIENGGVRMYDQGISSLIDLKRWLNTTMLGGALVVIKPASMSN